MLMCCFMVAAFKDKKYILKHNYRVIYTIKYN